MPANSMLNTVRPIAASTHPLRASTSGMSHLSHPQCQTQQWSSQCTIQLHSPATPFQRNTRQISKGIGRREHGRSGAREVEVRSLPSSERPPRGGVSGPLVEDDPRYNRVDSSELHAYQARQVRIQSPPPTSLLHWLDDLVMHHRCLQCALESLTCDAAGGEGRLNFDVDAFQILNFLSLE